MNDKGITLIELLATIVVLAIVIGIVFSNITSDVKGKKEELKTYQEELIKEAAESYIADYINDNKTGNCGTTGNPSEFTDPVLVNNLIEQGYLSDEYHKFEYSVSITCEQKGNNSVYKYSIVK